MTAKLLEAAFTKAATLPELMQEKIGRAVLDRIDAQERLRSGLEIGIQELDAGLGQELDVEDLIRDIHAEHAAE